MHYNQDQVKISLPDGLEERFSAIEQTQQEIIRLLKRQPDETTPENMTLKEAAHYARYSADHFRRLAVDQCLIPYIRPSKCQKGRLLFSKKDIDAFLTQVRKSDSARNVGPGRPRKSKDLKWW